MNWRKPLIFGLLHLTRSKIPHYLKEIEELQYKSKAEIENYQDERLNKILLHAYETVPYYNKNLKESEVVIDGNVNLANFSRIPILTKEIIRQEGNNLYSNDYKSRKPYENTSGGSTGEPVKFIQDKQYWQMNIANKFYFNRLLGKDIGEKEIDLWGSERDIFKNTLSLKEKKTNLLYNRTFLNAFKVDEDKMKKFVSEINRVKPISMWVYVESIDLLARFIEEKGLEVYSPKFIISTAGTLFPEIRERVETVFECPVYNQYGSREVGPLAVECEYRQGLHCFPWSQKLELIDDEKRKRIIVTDLTNYSMPLIRYNIGDVGKEVKASECKCGRNSLLFQEISGRVINHFITKELDIVHGQYFIHLFYFRAWIQKFQVVQKDYDLIKVYIILNKEKNERDMADIENKIKFVMGKDCKVEFEFVDEIEPTKSGKYLYTLCEVK
jgi:phenylacetate-CoA ligase